MADAAIVPCPSCGERCSVDPAHLTRRLRCPHCGKEFVPAGGGGGGGGGGRDRDRDRDDRRRPVRSSGSGGMMAMMGIGGALVLVVVLAVALKKGGGGSDGKSAGKSGAARDTVVVEKAAPAVDPRGPMPLPPDETIQLSTPPSGSYVICSTLRDTHMTVRLWKDPHELWRAPPGGKARKAGNVEHDSKIEALGKGTNKYGTTVYKVRGRTKHNQDITGYVSAFYVEYNHKPITDDTKYADEDEWERRGLEKD